MELSKSCSRNMTLKLSSAMNTFAFHTSNKSLISGASNFFSEQTQNSKFCNSIDRCDVGYQHSAVIQLFLAKSVRMLNGRARQVQPVDFVACYLLLDYCASAAVGFAIGMHGNKKNSFFTVDPPFSLSVLSLLPECRQPPYKQEHYALQQNWHRSHCHFQPEPQAG